jgi:hypothetical protein
MKGSETVRDVSRPDEQTLRGDESNGGLPPGALSRAWALSLAWGWLVLLTVAALAVAFDAHAVRDALDLAR